MPTLRVLTFLMLLAACGDNLHELPPQVDACGVTVDAADAAADATVDASLDCRRPPCGEPQAAWDAWATACFAPGECRLVHCPAMGDNLVNICRP